MRNPPSHDHPSADLARARPTRGRTEVASVGEVAAAIRAALAEVAEADGLIGAARERYDQVTGLLAAITDGTDSADVSVALAALADSQQKLDNARAAVAASTREMQQYLHDIGASPGLSSAPAAPQPPEPTPTSQIPVHVRRAAARLPNRRADGESDARGEPRMPTAGIALDDNAGYQPICDTIVSGRGPGSRAPGLDRRQRWGNSLDHVESHTAARMRANRTLRRVTLILNNRPCGPDQRVYNARTGEWEPRRYTCDELLPSMLPRGTELTVWVRQAGHLRFWRRYTGTGEGVVEG